MPAQKQKSKPRNLPLGEHNMVRTYLSRGRNLYQSIRERLPKFQAACERAKSDPEKIRVLRGLVMIGFTFLFGYISLQVTESAAIVRYKDENWPHPKIWSALMISYGYREAKPVGNYTHYLNTHPSAFSEDTSIWYSPELKLVYLPKSTFQEGGNSELWLPRDFVDAPVGSAPKNKATLPQSPKTTWVNLGAGWTGIEKLTETLDQLPVVPLAQNRAANAPISRNWVDPKEIRY